MPIACSRSSRTGWRALAQSRCTLPGVSSPESVVKSMTLTARSSQAACHCFFTVRRVPIVAARRSTALLLMRVRVSTPRSSGVPGLRAGCAACAAVPRAPSAVVIIRLLRANDSARLWQDPPRRRALDERGGGHRAGESVLDLCRACKAERAHTAIAVDPEGRVLRVMCDFCGSQHNYRGGGDDRPASRESVARHVPRPAAPRIAPEEGKGRAAMSATGDDDLEQLLRRVLREELGLTTVAPAERWRGGELVLRPGK